MSAFPWTGAREYAGNKDRLAAFETAREQDSQLDHRVADDGNDACRHVLTSLLCLKNTFKECCEGWRDRGPRGQRPRITTTMTSVARVMASLPSFLSFICTHLLAIMFWTLTGAAQRPFLPRAASATRSASAWPMMETMFAFICSPPFYFGVHCVRCSLSMVLL